MNILLSIILGLIPEGLFYSLFMIGCKNIKSHKVLFTILNILAFNLISIPLHFNIWYYLVLPTMLYLILKLLYKDTEFIDSFVITVPFAILAILGYLCYGIGHLLFTQYSYFIMLLINRSLLIIVISALYLHLNKCYNTYRKLWNKHIGSKIKSITIRNISIMLCSTVILLAQYSLVLLNK